MPICDSHRHLGELPPARFYDLPDEIVPAKGAAASVADLLRALDDEGTERALVMPNYGVPDPEVSFALNELVLDACATEERISCALWVSPKPGDAERTERALALAGERGVRALKATFLLGGAPDDPECAPQLDRSFAVAAEHDLVVHIHTSPGGASDVDRIAHLVDRHGDHVAIHLVHLGGGVSGHIKLVGGRFFDWIEQGKRIYTDASWAIGFASSGWRPRSSGGASATTSCCSRATSPGAGSGQSDRAEGGPGSGVDEGSGLLEAGPRAFATGSSAPRVDAMCQLPPCLRGLRLEPLPPERPRPRPGGPVYGCLA